MKKFTRFIAVTAAVLSMALGLSACGSASSGSSSGTLSKVFTGGTATSSDSIGWYASEVFTLKVNANDTYELIYQDYMFGTTDPGSKGLRTVIYTGKCSSAASADGWETHLDYTLQPADRIYFEQHEKGFGRSVIAGHCVIDTANWTDATTQLVDPENGSMDAKAFLAEYGETLTVTVEDPSKDAEDTSLGYKIVTLPELKLVSYAG